MCATARVNPRMLHEHHWGGSFQDRGALHVCDRSHHFTDRQRPGPQAGGQQNSGTAPCGVFKPTQEPVTITAVSAQS